MRRLGFVMLSVTLMLGACGQASDPEAPTSPGQINTVTPLDTTESPPPAPNADPLGQLVADNTELAIELFSIVASGEDNVALAPASISEGLALPYLGARGGTANEMAEVLRYTLGDDELFGAMATLRDTLTARENDQLELAVANRAFGHKGFSFRDEYLADLSRWYEAALGTVDFGDAEAARAEINEWTADQTNQKITELFPSGAITTQTRLALVNAVYLNADWYFPFNPELTSPQPFELLDGSTVEVDTMNFNEWLPNGSGAGWSAIRMPYAGEEMSMMIVLPDNLKRFKSNFTSQRITRIRRAINDEAGIHLSLPKFELSYHLSLIPALRELGMTRAFESTADFSGISDDAALHIGAIEHETYVKVDEEGTEAAGATGTSMPFSHGPTIKVDRPFIFWIQDDATGAILFIGQVTNPRSP